MRSSIMQASVFAIVLAGWFGLGACATDEEPKVTSPADRTTFQDTAERFIDRLITDEFDQAVEMLLPAYAKTTNAAKLQEIWQKLAIDNGAFQKRGRPWLQIRPTGNFVYLPLHFGTREYRARLQISDDKRISYVTFVPAPLNGPGLITATSAAAVVSVNEADVGTVTFPIPGLYRDQIPINFALKVSPPEALRDYAWRRREDGLNWLCDVKVAPGKDGALLRWEALVLVNHLPPADLPVVEKADVPTETEQWTRRARCVQCDDPKIQAKAAELQQGITDIGAFARKVMEFTSTNPLRGEQVGGLDASNALHSGGSCTSRANLGAALLRARGIPARTLAHLPTWSGPLYEHWLVEYWHPGAGWVWLETSINEHQPSPASLVVLNVANRSDEDNAFQSPRERGVAPGAPYLAVQELSKELRPDYLRRKAEDTASLATPEVTLEATEAELKALFDAARTTHERLARDAKAGRGVEDQRLKLLIAARSGGAKLLTEILKNS